MLRWEGKLEQHPWLCRHNFEPTLESAPDHRSGRQVLVPDNAELVKVTRISGVTHPLDIALGGELPANKSAELRTTPPGKQ